MRRTPGTHAHPPVRPSRTRRPGVVLVAALALLAPGPAAAPAAAHPDDGERTTIALPGASSAEGIAAGRHGTFYAGDLQRGDIFRGNVRRGEAEPFIDAPDGRYAVGLKADTRRGLLFVAGGPTGDAYVYDTGSGETVRTYELDRTGFINDVALTGRGAWFTNSQAGELYFVPIDEDGEPGSARTLDLAGPAADTGSDFNLNGIAASRDGRTLVVAHSGRGRLYTVDARTGDSEEIEGVHVPYVDGIVLRGRSLWAVRNMANEVSRVRLDRDLGSGRIVERITDPAFQVPTTAALFGGTLAVVNAKFDEPDADEYEVVLVDARGGGDHR